MGNFTHRQVAKALITNGLSSTTAKGGAKGEQRAMTETEPHDHGDVEGRGAKLKHKVSGQTRRSRPAGGVGK